MDNIEKIVIGFENCDSVDIKYWDFNDLPRFLCSDIIDECFNCNSNHELLTRKIARYVELEIPKKMLSLKMRMDNSLILDTQLKFRDITSIKIYTYDDIFCYDVLYEEENELELGSPNKNQYNIYMPDGSIKILITNKLEKENGTKR